jgi:hypothetical protein
MSLSDKVPIITIIISLKVIRELTDLETLSNLVKSAPDTELTPDEKLTKDRFLKAKAKLDSGTDPESPAGLVDDFDEQRGE